MLEGGQVFVTTFNKTQSRNMSLINDVLFFLVAAFSIGYIQYFSIKMKINHIHFTSHRCFLLPHACSFVLPVFPTSLLIIILFFGSQLCPILKELLHLLDIRALLKQKHKSQCGQSLRGEIFLGYRIYFCFINLPTKWSLTLT